MRQIQFVLALLAASVLAACGGSSSSSGDQSLKTKFSAQVVFGDSLSDVGTYAVGTVKALGGGKFTINGDNTSLNPALTGKNWTELMAKQFGLAAPCAAQTGLHGDASQGFSVPVVNHAGCLGYAQGGARVTAAVGPGNTNGTGLGALTVPVVTQIQSHLAVSGGKFKGDEIVFVMAGANDVLVQLATLSANATAAGTAAATAAVTAAVPGRVSSDIAGGLCTPTDAQASNCVAQAIAQLTPTVGASAGAAAGAAYVSNVGGPAAVQAMGQVAVELVALVKTQVLANGANFVVVNNLPDIASTPDGLAQSASIQGLMAVMVKTFNDQLNSGLSAEAKVVLVDVYAVSHDQATNPAPYGLTNVKDTACDLSAAKNPLGSSLVCTANNLKAGDVSHYSYADEVHPTPFLHFLLARYVSEKLAVKGWI